MILILLVLLLIALLLLSLFTCFAFVHLRICVFAYAFVYRYGVPNILSDCPLEKIYKFDEYRLLYRILATFGNVVSATKNRRGAKLANDRITIGIFFNATGSKCWKPATIGTAKNSRCFGNYWTLKKACVLYYVMYINRTVLYGAVRKNFTS